MLTLAAGADGELDTARVTAAIEWASSEADSYLSARYPTPISPVPPILTNCVGDIARYRLTGHNTLENEVILRRYEKAIGFCALPKDLPICRGRTRAGNPGTVRTAWALRRAQGTGYDRNH